MTDFSADLSFLDGARRDMTETLRRWCAINSGSGNLDGLSRMRAELAEAFATLEADVETVPAAAHEVVTSDGETTERAVGASLRLVKRSALADRIGYEVIINADEEIGSHGSAPLIAEAARCAHFACVYEPALADDANRRL